MLIDRKGIDNLSDSFVTSLTRNSTKEVNVKESRKEVVKIGSLKETGERGFKSCGTGFYKDAQHHLWKVEKTDEGYQLIRSAEEDKD